VSGLINAIAREPNSKYGLTKNDMAVIEKYIGGVDNSGKTNNADENEGRLWMSISSYHQQF
jgi:hypothetical protein